MSGDLDGPLQKLNQEIGAMNQKFSRSLKELQNLVAMTDQFFIQNNILGSLKNTADLIIEELFVNMVSYNTETKEDILVELLPKDKGIQISITDFDVERFDPASIDAVDTGASLMDRQPGGLGLYLVLKMSDSIHYEYRNRQSKITVSVESS